MVNPTKRLCDAWSTHRAAAKSTFWHPSLTPADIEAGWTYQGPDRRRPSEGADRPDFPHFILALVVVGLALGIAARIESADPRWPSSVNPDAINAMLATAGVAVAAGVALLCLFRWRLLDDAGALLVGVAIPMLYIGSRSSRAVVRPFSHTPTPTPALAAQLGIDVVATILVIRAIRQSTIDVRMTPRWLFGRAVCWSAVAGTTIFLLWSPLEMLDRRLGVSTTPFSGILVAVWCGCGAVHAVRGLVTRRRLYIAVGFGVVMLALGEAVAEADVSPASVWRSAGPLFGLVAMSIVLRGCLSEIGDAMQFEQSKAFSLEVTAVHQHEFELKQQQRLLERRHDQTAAVVAIQGVVRELAGDAVGDQRRTRLTVAAIAELARLQRGLVESPDDSQAFSVFRAIAPVVSCEQARGVAVTMAVPAHLVGFGRPDNLTEVVQSLVENAFSHGANRKVRVSAGAEGPKIRVRVEDDGPGIPRPLQEVVFERGVTSKGEDHSGFGLYTARRLMTEMGGDLQIDDVDRTSGVCFVATFPGRSAQSAPRTADFDGNDAPGEWRTAATE